MMGMPSGRADAAYYARIEADKARHLKADRIRILKGLLSEGYLDSTGLAACLRDIENDAFPLAERIGRGFTA